MSPLSLPFLAKIRNFPRVNRVDGTAIRGRQIGGRRGLWVPVRGPRSPGIFGDSGGMDRDARGLPTPPHYPHFPPLCPVNGLTWRFSKGPRLDLWPLECMDRFLVFY